MSDPSNTIHKLLVYRIASGPETPGTGYKGQSFTIEEAGILEIKDDNGTGLDQPNSTIFDDATTTISGSSVWGQELTSTSVDELQGWNGEIDVRYKYGIETDDGGFDIPSGSTIHFLSNGQTGFPAWAGKIFVSTIQLDPSVTYKFGDYSGEGGIAYKSLVPCFTRGTQILTNGGYRPIETLQVGDLIATKDAGFQPLQWIGSRQLNKEELAQSPKLRPIRIKKNALGPNTPSQDLYVSPQHRIFLHSQIIKRMYVCPEILVAATKLTHMKGIDIVTEQKPVEYFHMLFSQHHIVYSNGAASESLFTGPYALAALGDKAREEIYSLFPELRTKDYTPTPARPIVGKGKRIKKMIARHQKNQKPLQTALIH